MNTDLIKAHLNLYAVLQNLEDLVRLDAEMAVLTRGWNVAIQFSVWNGPAAHVAFANGACTHGVGAHPRPSIKLLFTSPGHLNAMFDGKGTPIPLKGFTRLGFLKNDFSRLTDRMAYYLKPDPARLADANYMRINTILTLHTAVYAVRELALLEPISQRIASHIPSGALQVDVLPDGPAMHLTFAKGTVTVAKRAAENPTARMTFRSLAVANALLANQLDPFLAVAQADVMLEGLLPIIDNFNLILDRVPVYLA